MFDGLDMHLYGLVALPFVTSLIINQYPALSADAAAVVAKDKSGIIQAAFLFGWALGGGFFGRLGDVLGRSRALSLTILTYACFTGLSFFAQTWWQLLIFRFVAALGIGGEWAVGSALLSETWPRAWRPWIAAVLQTGVNLGVLLACLTTYILADAQPRWVFLIGVVPAFIVFWIRRNVPEPDEWHAAKAVAERQPGVPDLFAGPVRRTTLLTIIVCACGLTAWWAFMFWHAHHGDRLREADWQRIEVLRELGPLLELANATSLRPWLAGIDAASDAHRIESALRERWRDVVAEVAGWMPARWRPAIAWWATLPDLAPLQHLARGEEPAAWLRDDDAWRDLFAAPPAARAARLAEGPLAALAAAWSAPQALPQLWQAEWRRRWPDRRRRDDELLEPFADAWIVHGRRFGAATGGEGWLLRGSLRAQLVHLLRRAALQPAVAFVHLALCAIDFERLRAELLRRVAFARRKAA